MAHLIGTFSTQISRRDEFVLTVDDMGHYVTMIEYQLGGLDAEGRLSGEFELAHGIIREEGGRLIRGESPTNVGGGVICIVDDNNLVWPVAEGERLEHMIEGKVIRLERRRKGVVPGYGAR